MGLPARLVQYCWLAYCWQCRYHQQKLGMYYLLAAYWPCRYHQQKSGMYHLLAYYWQCRYQNGFEGCTTYRHTSLHGIASSESLGLWKSVLAQRVDTGILLAMWALPSFITLPFPYWQARKPLHCSTALRTPPQSSPQTSDTIVSFTCVQRHVVPVPPGVPGIAGVSHWFLYLDLGCRFLKKWARYCTPLWSVKKFIAQKLRVPRSCYLTVLGHVSYYIMFPMENLEKLQGLAH